MSEQAELADPGGYLEGKAGLHRLVEAHCGLELTNVRIRYGKNTPYDPDPEMEPETTEYDHSIFVQADFAHAPGPHARFTEWLAADHTIEREHSRTTHNWYLALDTVVKESHHMRRVPGKGQCFHHELVGQVRDELVRSRRLGSSLVEVIPRDLKVEAEEAILKVETWIVSGQDFSVARFERRGVEWRLRSIKPDPDEPCC